MAMVNVSLNTDTREIVLAIDGQLVSCDRLHISKYNVGTEESPVRDITFLYSVVNNSDGLTETKEYYLPQENSDVASNEHGLAEKLSDDKTAEGLISHLMEHKSD